MSASTQSIVCGLVRWVCVPLCLTKPVQATEGYRRVVTQRPGDFHEMAQHLGESRMNPEPLAFQGMALLAIGVTNWEIEPILTRPDGTRRMTIGWDCGRDATGKRITVETLTGLRPGSVHVLMAGMTFAGACLEACVKGADTAYTVKDWKPIATCYGLFTGEDVIKIKPAVSAWWLTGGGSAASLQSVIRKALI